MPTHNPNNERIKRRYFAYLKEAKRHSESTVDAVAKALARFETDTRHRDFNAFHFEQAIAFKKHLAEQKRAADRGAAEQGDLECHTCARQAVLPLARRPAGLQIAPAICMELSLAEGRKLLAFIETRAAELKPDVPRPRSSRPYRGTMR